jgi:hypothetical protein
MTMFTWNPAHPMFKAIPAGNMARPPTYPATPAPNTPVVPATGIS